MPDFPTVSVVLPVYNGVRTGSLYLKKAMESLRDQDYEGKIQIVIVDDGSTDLTQQWVKKLLREWTCPPNRKFQLLEMPHRGVTKALNTGLKSCEGEFIARCDADDYCSPQRVRLQVAYFQENPTVGLLASTIKTVDSCGAEKDVWYYAPGIIRREAFRKGNPICHGSVMLRRTAVNRAGLYDESYTHAQDYEYFWRISKFVQLASHPEVLYFYRVHPRRITADPARAKIQRACSVRIQNQIKSELENARTNP